MRYRKQSRGAHEGILPQSNPEDTLLPTHNKNNVETMSRIDMARTFLKAAYGDLVSDSTPIHIMNFASCDSYASFANEGVDPLLFGDVLKLTDTEDFHGPPSFIVDSQDGVATSLRTKTIADALDYIQGVSRSFIPNKDAIFLDLKWAHYLLQGEEAFKRAGISLSAEVLCAGVVMRDIHGVLCVPCISLFSNGVTAKATLAPLNIIKGDRSIYKFA